MSFIIRRHNTWYAHLIVPKDCRKSLGRSKFQQSLKTDSRSAAIRLSRPVIMYWKSLIDKAREGGGSAQALIMREVFSKTSDPDEAREVKDIILEHTYDVERLEGTKKAKQFYDVATGKVTLLSDHIETYLAAQDLNDGVLTQRRVELKLLQTQHKTIEEVTRMRASEFVQHLAVGRKPRTVNKMISTYSTFWHWLMDRGYYPEHKSNPWSRQRLKVKQGQEIERRPFTEDEARMMIELVGRKAGTFPDDLPITKILAVTGIV